ncbi:bifunctional hydroxylase/dehydrase [Streptomyces puniciscabiei]|uniref:Bifunctional hydroxylase/dehydrase n=1 Tax=Streptomyces puniciscabiei TaxID=164348 RepID=A0A542SXF4_9ACTN|nr:FAD-dependent monooxygenase [Streptomyces puniciscabiei]TQK79296.1 bifunctional hydroxylase/dehydrase [Streptomyces puniciscabiei]
MDAPVIIVGAGPAGLMLAAELRLGGVEVLVLDRLEKPSQESRSLGFTARAVELFDQRGLLPRFGELGISTAGHFGGLPLDYSVLMDAHFGARSIPQATTERVLGERAAELGAEIRRGWTVVGLHDDGDSVRVEAETPGGPRLLRCRYLVGCDGGHSFVRGAAGFEFPGTPSTREMFVADIGGCALRPRPIGERLPTGMVMATPLGDDVDRIIVVEHGVPPRRRTRPPEFAEVADAWERLTGEDMHGGTAHWISSFGDATRQVTEYRRGSVLLAGDAAHTHLPVGGQGLSVGVQDAVNLGWKLAAVVRGSAPPDLLDSYHAERHPVGARLLLNTLAQGVLFLSGAEVEPLREVVADLMELPEVRRHLAGMVSGLDIRYDVGPGAHPLLGARIPKRDLHGPSGATTTIAGLSTGRGVLLDLADDPELRRAAEPWADRVDVVTAAPHRLPDGCPLAGTSAVLLRPDGHVAWADPGCGPLPDALDRWFGASRLATSRQ